MNIDHLIGPHIQPAVMAAPPQDPLLAQLLVAQQEANQLQERLEAERKYRQRIVECDGTDVSQLKRWLTELTTVPEDHRAAVMRDTARGTLFLAFQAFVEANAAAGWEDVRNHLIQTFISADHAAVLRAELDEMRRKPFETIPIFSQRFRALADLVFPPAGRNPLQEEVLIQTFTRALDDEGAQRRVVRGGFPATLVDTIHRLQTMETEAAAFKKATGRDLRPRQDQPMEVDAIASAVAAKLQPTSPQPPIDVQHQATEIAKLKAQVADLKKAATRPPKPPPQLFRGQPWSQAPAPRMSRRLPPNQERQPGTAGKPRSGLLCFTCGRPGHLARACQTKN